MRIPPFAVSLALVAATASYAEAPLFFVDSPFDPPMVTSIYTVNPASGVMTARAHLGSEFTPVYGMAAVDGRTLYAAGSDTTGTLCSGLSEACLLLRIVLDPTSTLPEQVQVIGPIHSASGPVSGIVGMTFRNNGVLYVDSQDDNGLYTMDPATGLVTLVGVSNVLLHGGDITFDANDRLSAWSNGLGPESGLYELNPSTAQGVLVDPDPGWSYSGLAALGHSNVLYATGVFSDRLFRIDPVTGFTGESQRLMLDGQPFDHKRGDLDSPYCTDNTECADANPCTTDRCTAGGCRHLFEDATCDGVDDDCDGSFDEDGDVDGDQVADCVDNCRDVPNTNQLDTDGDDVGNACDCAPNDPQNAPPPEVGNTLRLGPSPQGTVVSWIDNVMTGPFRVYRGTRPAGSPWTYNHACLGGPINGTSASDPQNPPPGTLFYYAVARVGCGQSVLARDGSGTPIPGGTCP